MKQYCFGLVFFMVMLGSVCAQTAKVPAGMSQVSNQYYTVWSDGGSNDANLLARELESRFKQYNSFFHFNPQEMAGPLKVRAYKDRDAYNAYVSERLDKTSPGAVYLHYSQPERRELVIHRGSEEEAYIFPHQVFIQYLRAFISNPPAWFREGFAIYFSTLKANAGTGTSSAANKNVSSSGLVYEENLAWLETVKSLGSKAPSLESVLLADVRNVSLSDNFQAVSWALVSFLKDGGNEDYLRILYECFMILNNSASAAANSEALMQHIRRWADLAALDRDYKKYLSNRKTFAELITEGQKAYTAKNAKNAEYAFLQAHEQKPTHYVPYYYLGLLAYDSKDYEQAEQYYRSAQQYGAEYALVSYARGINAASAGHNTEAIDFLEQAKKAAPDQYNNPQVDNLIRRLR